jgi:hypothetical protein
LPDLPEDFAGAAGSFFLPHEQQFSPLLHHKRFDASN